MDPEVVLLIGLPGAGKSTAYRERWAATHAVVSKDIMPRSAKRKEARLQRELDALLAQGRSVVVDNTQVSVAERAGVIAVARARGARVVAHWFPPDPELCSARNAQRPDPVPEVAIRAALRRFEEPTAAESFTSVRVCSSGRDPEQQTRGGQRTRPSV